MTVGIIDDEEMECCFEISGTNNGNCAINLWDNFHELKDLIHLCLSWICREHDREDNCDLWESDGCLWVGGGPGEGPGPGDSDEWTQ